MTDTPTDLQVLDITAIEPYEHNPRKADNPEYDAIKASMRVDGMTQPLVVTQRPGSESFVVGAGGITRLQIVKDLFAETQEPRFAQVPCRIIPWTDETTVLLAHLKENDLRGNLSFFDRARAVMDLKAMIEADNGSAAHSYRAFAEALGERGYRTSYSMIADMSYTMSELQTRLPLTLSSGLQRAQVQRIRKLDIAVRALWSDQVTDAEPFDEVFTVLCRRHDGDAWEFGALRRSLERELAERAQTSVQQISLALDALLDGRPQGDPAGSVAQNGSQGDFDTEIREVSRQENSVTNQPEGGQTSNVGQFSDSDGERGEADEERQTRPALDPRMVSQQDDDSEAPLVVSDMAEKIQSSLSTAANTPGRSDLKSLRARAWTLAARLAQRNGIGELIQAVSGQGLGYMVIDVPAPALADHLDEDELAKISMLWWQLAACAEVTVAPVELVVPHLDPDSVLKQALETQDGSLLFNSVWTLDPGHTGYRLWRSMDDRDWQDYRDLIDTYRSLYRFAADTQTALWN